MAAKLKSIYPGSPLGLVLNDIERSIEARLYYPALLITLTVPEICSALAMDKSVFVRERHYVEFLEKFAPNGVGLSPVDCYRLRGGLVHRASFSGHDKFGWTHVLFTTPEGRLGVHAITISSGGKRGLALDVAIFCREMIAAADRWYEANGKNPLVRSNMPHLIRFCPNGLAPFYEGLPIVASGE